MADYRVIKLHKAIGNSRYYYGSSCYQDAKPYVAQRKNIFGRWVDIRLPSKYTGGMYRIGYAASPNQEYAERFIKIYVGLKLDKPKKGVDVVAEFDYIGPKAIDKLLERIENGRSQERVR